MQGPEEKTVVKQKRGRKPRAPKVVIPAAPTPEAPKRRRGRPRRATSSIAQAEPIKIPASDHVLVTVKLTSGQELVIEGPSPAVASVLRGLSFR